MSHFFRPLLHFLFHIGYLGPFLMGIMDSSFLFLPFGNDLLVVALVARHHGGYALYVLTAVLGSTLGVLLLDMVARKLGESGVTKVVGERRFKYLKKKIGQHGSLALVLGCLAPPPFPFTMAVATLSVLSFPRVRLLVTVALTRAARFLILGFLAIRFGRAILAIAQKPVFIWSMSILIALCIVGSGFSIVKWVRNSRRRPRQSTAPATA